MYAVILTGGKQYKVQAGDILKIEKLEQEPGEKFEFDKVLLVGEGDDIKIGNPYLDGAKVSAEIVNQSRGEKLKIVKFRRRKHSMTRKGHRQYITEVKITDITTS